MFARTLARSTTRLGALALALLLGTSCDHNPAEPGVLATIAVTRNPDTLTVGSSRQFSAVGRDADGTVVGIDPAWSVAASGGSITSSGMFTAGSTFGTFDNTVTASVGSISGSATVTITSGAPLASVAVSPNPAFLATGGTQSFTATGRDAGGNVVAFAPTWTVLAGGGAIDGAGGFTAGSTAGTYTNTVMACSTATCAGGSVAGFATVTVIAGGAAGGPVLGAAATHGILAGSAVTCASAPGSIHADVSVWPGSAITGFPPCTIDGARHTADAFAQTAQGDLTTAYNAIAAMPCGTTITADLGGTTLAPGVYCSTSSVGVTGTVTLAGPADAVFVIRAPSTLTTAGSVILSGGAQAKNVYWWVGSSATLGTGSAWQGNVIAFTSITLVNNVTLTGRALARNGGVSMGTNGTITLP